MTPAYLSIDIETTGLKPGKHQIIEFAAVIDDGETVDIESLPYYQSLVVSDDNLYQCDPFAAAMNSAIFAEIAGGKHPTVRESNIGLAFSDWLKKLGYEGYKWTIAGKNFASFDNGFLDQRTDLMFRVKHEHRYIDLGNLYFRPEEDGVKLPDTATCMTRAGLDPTVKHRALGDARVVIQLYRNWIKERKIAIERNS